MTGEVFYYYYEENKIEKIRHIIKQNVKNLNIQCKFLNDSMTKDQHKKTVLKIKEDIKNGLIFQCEVGFKSHYEIKGDQTAIYEN